MPKKIALLIGVSEYGEGISPLSAALNDVAAMQRVLQNPNLGGFEQVEQLLNPDLTQMRTAIQKLFRKALKDDLVLLFFSGHGITNDEGHLYLATQITAKDDFEATAVDASFIHGQSNNCYAKRQVIILDACYSGAYAQGWLAKSADVNLKQQLGAEGRVILTSSSATQTSFEQEGSTLSLYTQYLVEGIETGAADKDNNGNILIHELHDYAKAKVQEVKPKITPNIILDQEGFKIIIAKAPKSSEAEYRKLVEKYAKNGVLSVFSYLVLKPKRKTFGLTDEKAEEIENEVLEPFRRRLANLELYKQAFDEAVKQQYPLDEDILKILKDYQQDILGLRDEDVEDIEKEIISERQSISSNQNLLPTQISFIKPKENVESQPDNFNNILTYIVCPLCAYKNHKFNNFCQNCGTSLFHKACPECSTDVLVHALNCHNCGAECGTVWWAIVFQGENSEWKQQSKGNEMPNDAPNIPSQISVGFYLDKKQRYQFLTSPSVQNAEIGAKVLDCQPYQLSPIEAILANQRQELIASIGEVSGIPKIAEVYIALQSTHHPAIPKIHDAWQDGEEQVVLIEDRSDWQYLLDAWKQETSSSLQILHWCYQMTQLWVLLEPYNCNYSLLDLSNLRLDEDHTLALQRLYLQPIGAVLSGEGEESQEFVEETLSLKALGRVWLNLCRSSKRTQFGLLIQVLDDLDEENIQTIPQLRSRLEKIAAELEA